MNVKTNSKPKADGWKALFGTLHRLRLPWLWIVSGLALNIILNDLMLDLPDTTAELTGGNLSGTTFAKVVGFYVVIGIMSFVSMIGQTQAQTYSVLRARRSIWNKMLGMKMSFFASNDPSNLISTITNDANAAVTDFVNCILYLIPDIYYVVAALKRIGEYHYILLLSCLAVIPLKYLYAFFMGRKYQSASAALYGKIGVLTGFLADRINHLPLIKAYTNEKSEEDVGKDASKKILDANMKLVHLDNIALAASSLLDILQKFIVVVVAVVLLQQNKIDLTMWLAFFLFAQNLFPNIDEVFDIWIKIKAMHGSFHRVIEIMDGESESRDGTLPFPNEGDIRFEDVSFTYPETHRPALSHVSFSLKRGDHLAIVGLCGSGKTTTISLLERFYTQNEGKIFIGDTDIRDISLGEFRKNFAYVQQGAEIFSGTLRDALTYGIEREISDEEINEAAARTGFYEYLRLCENGLDTEVTAGGTSMSGGQSQRLVLTRELLRGGNIVLMDEPTSALDVRISAKVQDTMDKVFKDKTRILITHDLQLAQKYDRILVMKEGRLVGDGTHDELMKTCETYIEMNQEAEVAAV